MVNLIKEVTIVRRNIGTVSQQCMGTRRSTFLLDLKFTNNLYHCRIHLKKSILLLGRWYHKRLSTFLLYIVKLGPSAPPGRQSATFAPSKGIMMQELNQLICPGITVTDMCRRRNTKQMHQFHGLAPLKLLNLLFAMKKIVLSGPVPPKICAYITILCTGYPQIGG